LRIFAVSLSAFDTYWPTLLRYVLVAAALGGLMYLVYRVQLWAGVKREAATGRALVIPWVVGFLVFNVFTIGASLYLSFTRLQLVPSPALGWYCQL
jgi:multiple sugar transport system permease protein